ncbi:MAG TPA: DUF6114 domain-containing protein [Actinospica sp.]|jgi:hypothetical protein|nr:DUF6114 domain-containing protein [Actinospica sp.]
MISTPEHRTGIGSIWDRFTAPTEPYRRPFRRWRRERPFGAGLSILLAGLEIYWAPHSSVGKMLSMGLPGISSLFIAIFLVVFGITVWFFPTYRVFAGIASILLALLSLVATNLGGFFVGFLLAMMGGAFAVAWAPRQDYTAETRRQRRHRLATDGAGTEAGTAEFAATEPESEQAVENAENTQIIEQAAHAGETGPNGTEPATEQE